MCNSTGNCNAIDHIIYGWEELMCEGPRTNPYMVRLLLLFIDDLILIGAHVIRVCYSLTRHGEKDDE